MQRSNPLEPARPVEGWASSPPKSNRWPARRRRRPMRYRPTLSGMQDAAQESVAAIKEIGGTIGQISNIASSIASAVEQQSTATQEIARSVQNVAQGTKEAAANVMQVNRGATETGSASEEVLNSAKTLSSESTRLREELDRFMANITAA